MKKNIVALLILSAAALTHAETLNLRAYPLMRTAKLKGTPEEIAAIPLDQKLYKNTNDRYSNIRIIDKDGRNIPFSVKNVIPLLDKHLYAIYPTTMTDFNINLTEKTAVAEFVINPAGNISRLTFPAQKEYAGQKISLEFFDKAGKKTGGLNDLLLKMPENNTDSIHIDFPPVKVQKIKITLLPDGKNISESAKQFLGDIAIEQKITLKTPGLPQVVDIALPEISRINQGSLTEITVNANRVPCTEMLLKADNKTFERYIEVFSRTNEDEKCIASQNFTQNDRGIPLKEVRGDLYVVRIFNADRQPLQNIRLQWEVNKKVLMFIPPEHGDLKIYYGGNAKQMAYDIEYAQRYGLPPQIYELGEETSSPDYEPQTPVIEIYKFYLWGILLISAIVLVITIIRMLNRVQDIENSRKQ